MPPYNANTGYVPVQSSHVLLTPFILPESVEALLSSGAFGGQAATSIKSVIKRIASLPLLVVIPSALAIVGTLWCLLFNLLPTYFPNFWKKLLALIDPATPAGSQSSTQKPLDKTFGPFFHYFNAPNGPGTYGFKRQRRGAEDEPPTSSTSGLPALSMAQVEKLTEVVFAALRSQQCIQRLLCEAGAMSRSFSETAHSVAKVVERFVPEPMKDSYEIFANADKCDQYTCGSLYVKK